MIRYIDADKLIESFKNCPFGGDSMTIQEITDAIDGFADAAKAWEMYEKKEKETFIDVRNILKKSGNALAYNMCFHTPWEFYGSHSVGECVEILLEKCNDENVPTKPIDVHTPVVTWGLCPVCKGELNKLGGSPNRVSSNMNYCPDCGQRIDWSETDTLKYFKIL